MAFEIENFYLDRASFNTSTQIRTFAMHRYINLDDTINEIESFDYFPPYFGYDNLAVRPNDYISIQSSDAFGNLYRITYDNFGFITLTGITESTKLYTFESTLLNISNSENPPFVMQFYKQGVFVSAYLNAFYYESSNISGVATVADPVPLNFSPVNGFELKAPVLIDDVNFISGFENIGMFRIHDGLITIGPFSSSGNPLKYRGLRVVWYPTFLSWVTN